MTRPIGVDLFAGAGGLSLGFEQAGLDVVAAVELDPIHAATHEFNFPNCAVIPKSVVGLTGREIREAAGIGSKDIDVVFGGPPCQGFSLIGQRAFDDPRNGLVLEFVRLVAELDANYFVLENVKGLTVGKHRLFLDELVQKFAEVGYDVITPWKVLNAVSYGVPQDRERLFLLGSKRGLPKSRYPDAVTKRPGARGALPDAPTCVDALDDLPDAEQFAALDGTDSVRVGNWGVPSRYAQYLRCMTNDAWGWGHVREWDPRLLTSSALTGHTEISRRRFGETPEGTVEPISRFFKLATSGVANTLRAGTDSSRGAFTSPRPIHYAKPRCITVREMARLHSFPDWFRFHRTKWHGARQVGNSVPPLLAKAVASEIVRALGSYPTRPSDTLALGNSRLLELQATEAAEYWGVPLSLGRRDRKSGAKKRKQDEIEKLRLLL